MEQAPEDVGEPSHAIMLVPTEELATYVLEHRPPLDQQPVRIYLRSLAPGSRRTMAQALHVIAALLTQGRCDALNLRWGALRFQHTQAVRSSLAEAYAPTTANKMMAALRGVLKAAWRLEQISTDDYHRAADVASVRGSSLPRGRALSSGELRALFGACAHDRTKDGILRPSAVRDAALLAALYGTGLRRSEVVALDLDDYNCESGELRVRSGKGHKARTSYAGQGAREAIEAWLMQRGDQSGPLFVPILKSGRLVFRRLSDQAVLTVLLKRAHHAGVKHLSPHDMRRSFISDLLDAGADISSVQKLAGHANVATTIRYDRRDEKAKRKAADLLHVPFSS